MKFSFKQVAVVLIAFLIGILISQTITDELLMIDRVRQAWESSTFWTALAAIATTGAAIIALYVAVSGARQSQHQHSEMIDESRKQIWLTAHQNAKMASYYFLHLHRIALMQARNQILGKTDEQDKQAYDEIYSKWSLAISNKDFTDTVTSSSSLLQEGSLVDELTLALFTLSERSIYQSTGDLTQAHLKRKKAWDYLSRIFKIFHDKALLECHRTGLYLSTEDYKLHLDSNDKITPKERASKNGIEENLAKIIAYKDEMKAAASNKIINKTL